MEYFAVLLTRGQGATVSQAFALAMSVRLVQIFWNTVAGLFVLRGGFHAPTETEAHELDDDAPDAGPESPAPRPIAMEATAAGAGPAGAGTSAEGPTAPMPLGAQA